VKGFPQICACTAKGGSLFQIRLRQLVALAPVGLLFPDSFRHVRRLSNIAAPISEGQLSFASPLH